MAHTTALTTREVTYHPDRLSDEINDAYLPTSTFYPSDHVVAERRKTNLRLIDGTVA
jgi:hypothetical protein